MEDCTSSSTDRIHETHADRIQFFSDMSEIFRRVNVPLGTMCALSGVGIRYNIAPDERFRSSHCGIVISIPSIPNFTCERNDPVDMTYPR